MVVGALDEVRTNKRGTAARFHLAVRSPVPADIGLGQTDLELPALADARIPLVITVDAARARPGLTFGLDVADDRKDLRRQEIRFVAPFGVAR